MAEIHVVNELPQCAKTVYMLTQCVCVGHVLSRSSVDSRDDAPS